jgi:hypothetical protein
MCRFLIYLPHFSIICHPFIHFPPSLPRFTSMLHFVCCVGIECRHRLAEPSQEPPLDFPVYSDQRSALVILFLISV